MTKNILFPAVLGGLVGFSAQAQDRGPREGDPRQNIREALIKKFDKNGDGKLDENERPSREQLQEFLNSQLGNRPSGRPGEGRPGGRPGEGRPGGRPGGFDREAMRAAMLKKFDKNGNGQIDENERPSREEMRELMRSQFGGGRPGEGRPGEGGRPGQGGRPGEGGRPGQGGRPGEGGRPGFGGFRMPPSPIITAIDANKDGEISAAELKNAAKALAALDKNKDGKISREEMAPQFGGRPGGSGDRPDFRSRPGGGDRPDFRRPGGREGDRRPGARPDGREGDRRPGARPDGDRRPPRREGDRRNDI